VDQSGAEDCFSRPRVKGDLLWGDFETWFSIMWTVLSGPDAVFSRPMVMGGNIEPEEVKCTKWTLMY